MNAVTKKQKHVHTVKAQARSAPLRLEPPHGITNSTKHSLHLYTPLPPNEFLYPNKKIFFQKTQATLKSIAPGNKEKGKRALLYIWNSMFTGYSPVWAPNV